MDSRIEIVRGAADAARTEGLACFIFEGQKSAEVLPAAVSRQVEKALARRRFTGKAGKTLVLPIDDGGRVLICAGLGAHSSFNIEELHRAAAAVVRAAGSEGVAGLAVPLPVVNGSWNSGELAEATVLGLLLGGYRFRRFLTKEDGKPRKPIRLRLAVPENDPVVRAAVRRGEILAESMMLARDMVNLPSTDLTPEAMVTMVRAGLRGASVQVRVLLPREIRRERMGALLGVAKGSENGPRVVHLVYRPRTRPIARLAFIGKGVTFDSGGYNLKAGEHMDGMKADMAGAAAVFGAIRALALLGAPLEIHGVLGLVENMVSSRAFRPGDVLRTRAGLTIEINNTDAEGRLVLADLLDFARDRIRPQAMVDLATLTGACTVALGLSCTGLFSNYEPLAANLLAAAKRSGEKLWRLPLIEDYSDALESSIADLRNSGGRYGGAITAALFLSRFVPENLPWAHLDIAGPAFNDKEHPFWGKGGTGAGLLTLVQLTQALARVPRSPRRPR